MGPRTRRFGTQLSQAALRAAVWPAYLDEIAVVAGASVAQALVDVEKFYDSLSPEKLLGKFFALSFPPSAVSSTLLVSHRLPGNQGHRGLLQGHLRHAFCVGRLHKFKQHGARIPL